MNRPPRRKESRANAILSMLPGHNTDDPPLLEPTGNTGQQNKVTDVTTLFTRPYSMVGPVFNTFCESQITYNSYHSRNLQENIDILNKAFPKKPEEIILKPVNATDISKKSIPEKQIEEVFLKPLEKSSAVCVEDFSEHNVFDPINLLCNEKMPSENSPPQISTLPESPALESSFNQAFVLDSDDSVLDKDYCPSGGDTSDSDEVPVTVRSKKKKIIEVETPSALVPFQQWPRQTLKPNNLQQRRNTVDACPTRKEEIHARKRKTSTGDLDHNNYDDYEIRPLDISIDTVEPEKKRKRYNTTLKQRQLEAKNQKRMTKYQVKPGCKDTCFKKCMANFSQEDRRKINDNFWNMTWQQRHAFVKSHTAVAIPKRKTTKDPKRKPKRKFSLKNVDGVLVDVCKIFFLTTLGFEKSNDKILYTSFTDDESDKRGLHTKTPPINRDLLTQHVESFNPVEPHYRREHAPLRRYIPSDISVATMHKHFQEMYPLNQVSYELYRKHVRKMNISFTRLGNEECEMCETFRLHKLQSAHDETSQADCNDCAMWTQHHNRYKKAREMYDAHKQIAQNNTQIYFSADLEKVIMLPRMESFKSVIFCQRLVAFNQTFAPLGKITNESKPVTVIWHDGIAGRKQEDIASAFYFFILRNRDVKNVNIWLDNCSAQNKNWLLYSLLVHLINSDLIATESITLYYFEPGHTFMSADQVHHQIELAMKRKVKIYDFEDFEEAVASINNSKVVVKSMKPENFTNVKNIVSDRRIQNSTPRAYLKNMVEVCFKRNNYDLLYRNDFSEDFKSLRFLNDRYLKYRNMPILSFRSEYKGVQPGRKEALLSKLSTIIPPHKLTFWQNLPVSQNEQTSTPKSRKTL